jgi:hypothetical protein
MVCPDLHFRLTKSKKEVKKEKEKTGRVFFNFPDKISRKKFSTKKLGNFWNFFF